MNTTPRPLGPDRTASLRALALVFLRLGATSFGGPAAHVAMMEEEVVRRRGWTMTIHRTDRPASEAALRLMTLVTASRGSNPAGR